MYKAFRYYFLVTTILFGFTSFLGAENKGAMIRELKMNLMASCMHGTIADHGDVEMENQIVAMVETGKTKEEITNFFVGKFGPEILAVPEKKGFNLMAWGLPFGALVISIIILTVYLKNRETSKEKPVPQIKESPYDEEIEKELEKMR